MASSKAMIAVFVLLMAASAQAYPQLWAMKYAPSCTAVPTKGLDCHKAPQADTSTSVTVSDGAGKLVQSVCPGQSYTVNIKFPNERLSFVTLSGGSKVAIQNDANKRCPNTASFSKPTGHSPSTSFSTRVTAPASGSWDIAVVSATGACAPYQVTKASVPVGKC